MNKIKSRHIWILIVLLTAFLCPSLGQAQNASGSNIVSRKMLVADKSRGIAYIDYDYNNNPQTIYFINGNEIRYTYSAAGDKLCAKYYIAVPNVTREFGVKPEGYPQSQIMCAYQHDYLLGGSAVMYNGMIDMVLFDGGYAKATPISSSTYNFSYYYYNKDHLGNNREVVNSGGTVQQVTNYYPFGAPYTDPNAVMGSNVQQYKYNGKELVTMHGLNTYDYGARQYDPILCRWDRVDPLAEKKYWQSPYTYGQNNPIIFVDPDGKDDYYTSSGQFLFHDQKETDRIFIRNTYSEEMSKIAPTAWQVIDTPIENMVLSAKAYSNIFTNVLSQMEGEDKVDNLYNNMVSVGVTFCDEDVKSTYNSPVLREDVNAVGGREDKSIKVTAKVNYGGYGDNRYMFSTVSNIQNLLGVHEYKGHGVLGWGSAKGNHHDVYMLQMDHPTWNRTTQKFKDSIIDSSKQY